VADGRRILTKSKFEPSRFNPELGRKNEGERCGWVSTSRLDFGLGFIRSALEKVADGAPPDRPVWRSSAVDLPSLTPSYRVD